VDDTPTNRPVALAGIEATASDTRFTLSCQPRTGSLLATLAASKPAGHILELGTGIGAGAAWLLHGMDTDATLITVEADPRVQAVARTHLGHDPRATFLVSDADHWLDTYHGQPFDLAFVDCRPGKFHRLPDLINLLRPGALYVGDDLLPQPTWPPDHQARVDGFVTTITTAPGLRPTLIAWAAGLVVAARV
jgi:predicted O-methyltransferase YrrM